LLNNSVKSVTRAFAVVYGKSALFVLLRKSFGKSIVKESVL